jgi:hypothetical protein
VAENSPALPDIPLPGYRRENLHCNAFDQDYYITSSIVESLYGLNYLVSFILNGKKQIQSNIDYPCGD